MLIATAGLAGCATEIMSEKECLAGDWYAAGLADGGKGLLETAYDERVAQCAKFGTAGDALTYVEGREAALSRLCTDEGGYAYGRGGDVYRGVCRAEGEEAFLGGYLSGRRIFALALARDAAQSAYDQAIYAIDYQRSAIDKARRVLDDPEATAEEIKEAHDDIDYARRTKRRLERDSDSALYELGRADEALDQAIASSAEWRRSDAFWNARGRIAEAHEFARRESAIDHCTDDLSSFRPACLVRPGATINDRETGVVCAIGPGEAQLISREMQPPGGRAPGWVHRYEFYPGEEGSGRIARRPSDGFQALFEGGETTAYWGVSCPASIPRG